jgi:hypothetical protein
VPRASHIRGVESGEQGECDADREHVDEKDPTPGEMVDDDTAEERTHDHGSGRERRP